MAEWKTLSSEIVYETKWIKIRRDEVLNQNGDPLTYSYMELQNPSVFIVAVNDRGEILIQSVYRYTVGQRFWEIPAGFIDKGEQPLVAAKRELMEEGGYTSDDWHHLGRVYQITGTGKVPQEVFLARTVRKDATATDKDEDITNHRFVSIKDIEEMLARGELIDSPVISSIYMAKVYGLTGGKE